MERCLDCNSLLTRDEKVCVECGTKVGGEKGGVGGLVASLASVAFYVSLASLIISPFTSRGPGFTFCLLTTFALLFAMRTAKDGIGKVKKR